MTKIQLWKRAPFIRLVIPLIIGIVLQYNFQFSLLSILFSLLFFISAFFISKFFAISFQYKIPFLLGFVITLILISTGILITFIKDIRHVKNWYGNNLAVTNQLVIKINEPKQEKAGSYKAECLIESNIINDTAVKTTGKIFAYFTKNKNSEKLQYGDRLLINNSLHEIRNSGNPGAFDYKKYAACQQIFHTAYLKDNEWVLLKEKLVNPIRQFIYNSRNSILGILNESMKGQEQENSVAEALLIGYTNDLDKEMIQAYSNTGVIHIIAISGMHLGLIYVMLLWVLNLIPIIKKSGVTKTIIILTFLWVFAFLTGANASILRSALMFSCILIGQNLDKKTSIYNSLAISAFILLCYNPYYLWDVGFELSYLAIIGIVVIHKHLFHSLKIENKLLSKIWEMSSLTISAQTFTFPLCLFYFHQFPNIFLLSNLIMIPLSSLILFIEILLVFSFKIPLLGAFLAKGTYLLIKIMNQSIVWFNHVPFAITPDISASIISTTVLFIVIIALSIWMKYLSKKAFFIALISLCVFFLMGLISTIQSAKQHTIIVYNISKHQAIDFISGNQNYFVGDSDIIQGSTLFNYNIKPARIMFKVKSDLVPDSSFYQFSPFYVFHKQRILLINGRDSLFKSKKRMNLDLIILSRNANVDIEELYQSYHCNEIVFDDSNPMWKIEEWKKDCERLHLRFHSTPENGAFIKNL